MLIVFTDGTVDGDHLQILGRFKPRLLNRQQNRVIQVTEGLSLPKSNRCQYRGQLRWPSGMGIEIRNCDQTK